MKKQALFAVCLTAASAAVFTGCATKQEVAAQKSQMEATEMTVAEEQQMEAAVYEETLPQVTPAETAAPTETPVEAAPKVEPVRPALVEYTVTAGDSVTALAVRFGVRKADILALNPSLRNNPGDLRIGQKLLFPAGTDVSKKAQRRETSAPPANTKRPTGTTVYTVKAGDVLGGIALKHGVTVADLKKANNLKKDMIWVGQKLTIPAASKTPAKKAPAKKAPAKPAEKKSAEKAPAKPAPTVTPVDAPVVEPIVEAPAPAPVPEVAPEQEEVLPIQDGDEILPPAPVVEDVATPVVQSDRVHVVKEGEDLMSISISWLVGLTELRALNGLDSSTMEVPVGTTLRIPMPANNK